MKSNDKSLSFHSKSSSFHSRMQIFFASNFQKVHHFIQNMIRKGMKKTKGFANQLIMNN